MVSSANEVWLLCDTGNWSNTDYEVSSMGRVRHIKTGVLLALHKSKVKQDGIVHPQYNIDGAWWHPDVLAHFVFLTKNVSLNRMSTISRLISEAESKIAKPQSKAVVAQDDTPKRKLPVRPRMPEDSEYKIVSSVQSLAQSLYKPASYERKEPTENHSSTAKVPSQPKNTKAEAKEKSPYIKTVAHVLWQYKEGAAVRGYTWKLLDDDAFSLMIRPCHYCGCEPGTNNKNGLNGIDRVKNELGYELGNVVPCCGPCNLLKGARTVDEFLGQVMAIAEFQKKSCESK